MNREHRDYLEDILASIDETQEFTDGLSFEEFCQDRKTINAVIRSLEVLGEAAKQIPEEIRVRTPSIPWKEMAGMRDKLIHNYFGVDLTIVWTAIHEELPQMRPEIERLLDSLTGESPESGEKGVSDGIDG
ncbi:MAG: DUF86 domain-containing protein [Candidatus Omnitrophica bacterium]|nr:DUF86 domain-containing protein [Candidatus Omnitrophota bacterium]MCA9424211.1 DUF86 domain-containing protein [Candidatus Omnitrophota bacterium]MCA9439850.1 DUF86 domain-containing protein [Candidatus Omnitrophota bacterium]